jgi:hypothetical protein
MTATDPASDVAHATNAALEPGGELHSAYLELHSAYLELLSAVCAKAMRTIGAKVDDPRAVELCMNAADKKWTLGEVSQELAEHAYRASKQWLEERDASVGAS